MKIPIYLQCLALEPLLLIPKTQKKSKLIYPLTSPHKQSLQQHSTVYNTYNKNPMSAKILSPAQRPSHARLARLPGFFVTSPPHHPPNPPRQHPCTTSPPIRILQPKSRLARRLCIPRGCDKRAPSRRGANPPWETCKAACRCEMEFHRSKLRQRRKRHADARLRAFCYLERFKGFVGET